MNQKGFVGIVILLIVLVIGAVGGAYYLGTKSNSPTNPAVTTASNLSLTPQPSLTTQVSQYCPQAEVSIPQLTSADLANSNIGKSNPKVGIAYDSETNYADSAIKAATDSDLTHVKQTLTLVPLIGSPLIDLTSQNRYGYNFPAVNKESAATYNKYINQIFIDMDSVDSSGSDHILLHEVAHYLSVRQNAKNLAPYLPQSFSDAALQAENNLLNCIREYDKGDTTNFDDALNNLTNKLKSHTQVSWQEIVDASNDYPYSIYKNPTNTLQFREYASVDPSQVKTRADDELYAEFSGYIVEAQNANLFDKTYQHPVYRIFSAVKR